MIPKKNTHNVNSPFFFFEATVLSAEYKNVLLTLNETSVQQLYPLKPFCVSFLLQELNPLIKGFSVSSLFEARLAKSCMSNGKRLHLTTPGIRADEMDELVELCDSISFNSISQWEQFKQAACGNVSCGLRVNPQISFVKDDRYNPCRKHSKLGVPLDQLVKTLSDNPSSLEGIEGIHFHNNCDSNDFSELLSTVQHLEKHLADFLKKIKWINLGGGYLFDKPRNPDDFRKAVELLQSTYGLEIFIEPGASIVRSAGYLVSTVIDLFKSDGKEVAVLDTTVNHMPEVFEYQFEPDVAGHTDKGEFSYILAGCSCLAGDIFGEYSFKEPLKIGSRVTFENVGAYTLVKAHRFNGINLPAIYVLKENGELELVKEFAFEEFASHSGAISYACT